MAGPDASVYALLFGAPAVLLLSAAFGLARGSLSKATQSSLNHFAGGVVFAAAAAELVPELLKKEAPLAYVIAGFASGVAVLLAVRHLFPEGHAHGDGEEEGHGHGHGGHGPPTQPLLPDAHGHGHEHSEGDGKGQLGKIPMSQVCATAIDLAIDGVLIGIGFATAAKAGLVLMLSISLEMVTLGAATASSLKGKHVGTQVTGGVMLFLAVLLVCGSFGGLLAMQFLAGSPFYFAIMGFGTSALLWLVVEELVAEAHEMVEAAEESKLTTLLFFLGFLLPIVLDKLSQ
eukprot:GHVU01009252.1.p1 GENE.GHVU01009252.1~~GHVU01009252.1.p1  ORF type:complete len:288 (+),score=49.48 GHVU01009252.1:145-1008(+)